MNKEQKTITVIVQKDGVVISEKTGHVIGNLLVDYDLIDKGIVPVQRDTQPNSTQLIDKLDTLVKQTDFTNHHDFGISIGETDFFILIAKVQKHIMDLDLEIKELKRCMDIPRIEDSDEIERLEKIIDEIAEIAEKSLVDTFGT